LAIAERLGGLPRDRVADRSRTVRNADCGAQAVTSGPLSSHSQNIQFQRATASSVWLQTWLVDCSRPEPEIECWLHPDVQIGPYPIAQLGQIACADIPPGGIVSRLGGRLVTSSKLRRIFADECYSPITHTWTRSLSARTLTWSCRPRTPSTAATTAATQNLWWDDAHTLVTRRAIGAGDEVTSDYATSAGVVGFAMDCACRSSLRRAVITNEDWRHPELQHAMAITGHPFCSLASGRAGLA
jgi:uncharacterized protein